MNYQDHLQSDYWQKVKIAIRDRDGNRCRVCNSSKSVEVHHRTYAHVGSELDHLNDLTLLCSKCHGMYHKTKNGGDALKAKRVAARPESMKSSILASSRPAIGQGMAKAQGNGYDPAKHDRHVPAPKMPRMSGKVVPIEWAILPQNSSHMIDTGRETLDWASENVPGGVKKGWMKVMAMHPVPLLCVRPKYRDKIKKAGAVYFTREAALKHPV